MIRNTAQNNQTNPHLRRRLEKAEGGGNAGGDADDAESVAEAGGGLRRQAAQSADTAERGRQVRHLVNLYKKKNTYDDR